MRNQEAARYARMAAVAAGLIALLVLGVYTERAYRLARARRAAPATVPSEVQQQSANFTYSDVEAGRTVFTLRASRATQFKEQNRALLDDVWITVYGRDGSRNDNIHTRQCSYEPASGGIRCRGEVQIELAGATGAERESSTASASRASASAPALAQTVEVRTTDLTFNRQTGEAFTDQAVEFRFPEGHGHGVGVRYSTHDATIRIDHAVSFDLDASERSGGLPVSTLGSSLEFRRQDREVVLAGPATVRQGERELSAGKISVTLDSNYHADQASAEDRPRIEGQDGRGKFSLLADRLEASISPQGWVTRLAAEGNVRGTRQGSDGTDGLSADRVEVAMVPGQDLARALNATGGVAAESHQGSDFRALKTEALEVNFSSSRREPKTAQRDSRNPLVQGQKIESLETLAPATIETKVGDERTRLGATRFSAEFGAASQLDKLIGHDGVEVRRQIGDGVAETSSAEELAATFAPNGEWASIDEAGHVHFVEADRQASAAKAKMQRSTGLVTLEGSPVLVDSVSRTTAGSVEINQQSGEIHATGGILSTYLAAASGGRDPVNLGAGPAHISADSLAGSASAGHVTYSGHARLWQGASVLEAEQIEIWRDEKKMEARGHIVAVFPQGPGAGPSFAMGVPRSPAGSDALTKPTLWQIRSPLLTYWSEQGRARLEGGVVASSDQGSLESRSLDAFLTPAGNAEALAPSGALASTAAGRELNRILAQGGVVVSQAGRRGTAEQAEYTAADQRFVLSGGEPKLTDASTDTTTAGRSLTFFVASDTILIDSQEGLRTLTKHRVEK